MPGTSIESVEFVKVRLPLLEPGPKSNPEKHRMQDRTTALVRKWSDLKASLHSAKTALYGNCVFKALKGDIVSLQVIDKEKFNQEQEAISAQEAELEKIEQAIRELDALGDYWLHDLENRLASLSNTQPRMEARKAEWLTWAMKQHKGGPIEAAMTDPTYLKNSAEFDRHIANAQASLDRLKPIFEKMRTLLESVSC